MRCGSCDRHPAAFRAAPVTVSVHRVDCATGAFEGMAHGGREVAVVGDRRWQWPATSTLFSTCRPLRPGAGTHTLRTLADRREAFVRPGCWQAARRRAPRRSERDALQQTQQHGPARVRGGGIDHVDPGTRRTGPRGGDYITPGDSVPSRRTVISQLTSSNSAPALPKGCMPKRIVWPAGTRRGGAAGDTEPSAPEGNVSVASS